MAITQSQSKSPASVSNTAVGRYLTTSTAAAITINCGFIPRYVKIANVTSGDEMEWYEGMAAASALKTVAAGTKTIITSNGVTVSSRGFVIGLDTDVNVISEQLSWIAIG